MTNSEQLIMVGNLLNIINQSEIGNLHPNPVWISACLYEAWVTKSEDYPAIAHFMGTIYEVVKRGFRTGVDEVHFRYPVTNVLLNEITRLMYFDKDQDRYEEQLEEDIRERGESLYGIKVFEDGKLTQEFQNAMKGFK